MFSSGGGGGGAVGGGGGAGGDGCGCGSNGNGGGDSGVWSSGMKKQQKRPKIPKRGPGVAELEKILREQEKSERSGINNNDDDDNVEGFSVSHSCFNLHPHSAAPLKPHCPPRSSLPPPPPPPPPMTATSRPPPPPSHVPTAPRFDKLSPPPPPPPAHLYGYNTATQGRNFPEQPLFPMNLSSSDGLSQPDHHHQHHSANSSSKNFFIESSNNHLWSSYSALPQKRHCTSQYSSTMVKQFLCPSAPPPYSSSSLSTGLHNHHEPPSNQSSYFNCISRNPEEPNKLVGMKRPHPCSIFEKSLVPSSTFQVPPIYSNFISRPHKISSSNNDNHISASNFTSSNNDCFSSRKFGSSEINGGLLGHSSFSSFINGAPVPSPPMLLFQRELCNNNINALPNFQVSEERMEESYQKSESSSGSDHQRPFFNFLEVKELVGMKETRVGSNHEGSEVGIDGPDLTLKL